MSGWHTHRGTVRLLAPLAADLKEWRMASGRPTGDALVFPAANGAAWTKDDWDVFRANGWKTASKHAGLVPAPRPYDLRHSFASLLLAEGRTVHYVAIADRWAPEHAATLEQSTRDRYADAYRLHIEPWLGDLPLTEITVGRLRSWQADRLADGVGVGTIDKARTVLSSVLRHAAESEAIPGNPLTLVRAPLAEHRDGVTPLAPVTVEAIRVVLAGAMDIHVPERIRRGGVRVAGYVVPDERDPLTRQRDATIVSVLAYAGLRPGELRALRWGDVRNATITVERAARPDGTIKSTKNHERRAVRLLAPLATDLAELRLAAGRPADAALVLPPAGEPTADAHPDAVTWTKTDWQTWRTSRWDRACKLATIPISSRPYDLRHSFASLLLAEGRSIHYVARRLGHSPALTLSTYGHLFAEYEHADRIDAAAEIVQAREALGRGSARRMPKARGRRPRGPRRQAS